MAARIMVDVQVGPAKVFLPPANQIAQRDNASQSLHIRWHIMRRVKKVKVDVVAPALEKAGLVDDAGPNSIPGHQV
jgi:hypothetical protein